MALYAQDAMETDKPWERWERMNKNDRDPAWKQCVNHPNWWADIEYRRKPQRSTLTGLKCRSPLGGRWKMSKNILWLMLSARILPVHFFGMMMTQTMTC
jgi:hypothetical protein